MTCYGAGASHVGGCVTLLLPIRVATPGPVGTYLSDRRIARRGQIVRVSAQGEKSFFLRRLLAHPDAWDRRLHHFLPRRLSVPKSFTMRSTGALPCHSHVTGPQDRPVRGFRGRDSGQCWRRSDARQEYCDNSRLPELSASGWLVAVASEGVSFPRMEWAWSSRTMKKTRTCSHFCAAPMRSLRGVKFWRFFHWAPNRAWTF